MNKKAYKTLIVLLILLASTILLNTIAIWENNKAIRDKIPDYEKYERPLPEAPEYEVYQDEHGILQVRVHDNTKR